MVRFVKILRDDFEHPISSSDIYSIEENGFITKNPDYKETTVNKFKIFFLNFYSFF